MAIPAVESSLGSSDIFASIAESNKYSIDVLISYVSTSRAALLDDQVRAKANAINNSNQELKALADMMAMARKLKANAGEDGGIADMPQSMIDFFQQHAIGYDSDNNPQWIIDATGPEWDVNIQFLQAEVDRRTTVNSQMMTELQSLVEKFNQAFELQSKIYESQSTNRDKVIDGLR